jgi:NAD(P)H-quinone oxidoreductase subunit 4L
MMIYAFIFSILLFALGLMLVLTKRNWFILFLGVELIINAGNVNFIAFGYRNDTLAEAQVYVLFAMVAAAAHAALLFSLVIYNYRLGKTSDPQSLDSLKE